MGFLKQNKDTNVECYKCNGNGIDRKGYIELLTVCKRCNGHGWVDWVAGVVKGSTHKPNVNRDILTRVAHQNIHLLRHKIIDIGMDTGFRLTVNVKTIDVNKMMLEGQPQLINLGGK